MSKLKITITVENGTVKIEETETLSTQGTLEIDDQNGEDEEHSEGPKMVTDAQKFFLKQNGYNDSQLSSMTARDAFLKIKELKGGGR